MFFIEVAINIPLHQTFIYLSKNNLQKGSICLVDFRNKIYSAVVINCFANLSLNENKYKSILKTQSLVFITNDILKLCLWQSNYYQIPIGMTFQLSFFKHLTSLNYQNDFFKINPNCDKKLKKKVSFLANKIYSYFELLNLRTQKIIDNLISQNILKKTPQKSDRIILKNAEYKLNDEQESVFEFIKKRIYIFQIFLLNGITGSGKTEIYLQITRLIIEQKKQVLILVPEINLISQIYQIFSERFNIVIEMIHSKVSDKKKARIFYGSFFNHIDVILGTRSAIFNPLPNLGLIIVDEEHDLSYKQQSQSRYNARDSAIWLAKSKNIPIILGSATPSFESLKNIEECKYHFLSLKKRTNISLPPSFFFVNMNIVPSYSGITKSVLEAIKIELEKNKQVLLFVSRRGFAPILKCKTCDFSLRCSLCDANLIYHKTLNKMICHHCSYKEFKPDVCPKCFNCLNLLGVGTQKVEEILMQNFSCPILRIDSDSFTQKVQLNLNQITKTQTPAILVGTQMLSKGHHFPFVDLVVLVDVDSYFYASDFRAKERLMQLIIQVSGRSGRESQNGQVIIQTRLPDNHLWDFLKKNDYLSFAKQELNQRRLFDLPPFSYEIMILANDRNHEKLENWFLNLYSFISQNLISEDIKVLGPIESHILRKNNIYYMQIILQTKIRKNLHKQILNVKKFLLANKTSVKWTIDVDPFENF